MKRVLSILVAFLFCTTWTNAQNDSVVALKPTNNPPTPTITLTGKVIEEETGTPLEYSTITLLSLEDSLIVTGGLTDDNGDFLIETPLRHFFLKIEFIACQPKIIDNIQLSTANSTIDLGTISLRPNAHLFEEVEVRTEKSSIMMSLDKRVFNVGKDLVSEGGTAEDILRNVPGVWVDIDGNVSLRGSGGVRILIEGQTSLLISKQNADGLRQIQANSIDRIEIITNPSARYEAEGMAGIINIILKKRQQNGLNGAFTANIGYPDNSGFGINMNYRKKNFNFFAGTSAWTRKRLGEGSYRNQFFNAENVDSTLFSNMDRVHERIGEPINIKVGGDYFFNSQNTLTSSFSYLGSKDNNTTNLIYKDAYGTTDNIHLATKRLERETGDEHNWNGFIRHRKCFASKGHNITSEIRYEREEDSEVSFYDEGYFVGKSSHLDSISLELPIYNTPDNTFFTLHQITHNTSNNSLFTIKSDYILPIQEESMLESGFQSTIRTITNDYRASDIINNSEIPDSNFTNNFKYHEIIHAAYINYGFKMGKLSFQTGLRAEHSNVESSLMVTNQTKTTRYLDLFPSAFIGYDFPNQSGIQLSYSKRIERPTFLDVSPFFTLRDRRNIWQGNPNIRPEYTHAFELGYIKYGERGTMSAIAYFRKTKDVIKRIQRLDERFPDATITQTENLALKRNYGIELTYALRPTKWWRLNGDVNFFHSFSGGTFEHEGKEIYVGGQSFSLKSKTISQFTFWDRLNSQIVISYSAPRTTTQGVNRAIFATDFATSIDILRNNGTVTLSISDLFNSRRRRSFSEDDTFFSEDNFLWQARSFTLSFHYRLNQHKKQSQIYASPFNEDDEERF